MAATAAIVAIFLPVAFMKGIIGAFFFQFGVTISVCVLLSLLEALTLTPSRSAQFLSVGRRTTAIGRGVEAAMDGLARGYRASLGPVLRHRWLVLSVATGLFAASLVVLPRLRREMTPSQDIGIFLGRLQTPVGSSLDTTDAALRKCEALLRARPEVKRVYAAVGGFGGGEVNTGILFVTLVPRARRDLSLQDFTGEMRRGFAAIPGVRVALQDLSLQGFTAQRGYPVEFNVQGPDWDRLAEVTGKVMDRMRETGLYQDLDTSYQVGMPELRVRPDRARCADAGVSMEDVAQTVNAMVGGVRAAKWKDRGRRYDIRVRLLASQRGRPEDVALLRVRARGGDLLPLSSLVSLEERPSLLAITRRGRERSISVFANVAPGASQAATVERVTAICREVLPEGYHLRLAGSSEALEETFRELGFALVLGLVVAYMILASQFNSFAHPLTVLAALPFSLSGALLALWLFDLSINIYSLIGVILLMGIVKKNSILLVDFTNQRRLEGMSKDEALLDACPKRLRPILMTSVSTVAGALPAALAAGPGGELRQPMAIAVVGGVIVSTFLTLLVVPALYSVLDSLARLLSRGRDAERETVAVLSDLQQEEIERFRHHRPVPAPGTLAPAATGDAA